MNSKKFSEAMSELDSKYIDEAIHYKKKTRNPKRNVRFKWGTIAACFAATVMIGVGILWKSNNPITSQQDVVIYFLDESGAMESKSVVIQSDPKDIFDEWAAVNNVSNVSLVDCIYDTQGTGTMQKDDGGEYSTLLLTVSPEFSKYVSNENSVFLIETLRRTFYDNNRFDNMNLIIESLTDSAVSNGVVEPGMQANDGKAFVWGEMSEREIDGTECYSFELRFSDDEEKNGEMTGRLWGIYAASNDGTKFYQYDMADDTWEQLNSTVREINLTTSDIAEISSVYDGTLLVDNLEFTHASATSVRLSYLGRSSDYENSDWEALSISADYADYTMTMNCSFHEAPIPADGMEKIDTLTYGDITVYLYRAAPTAEFEYIYTAIFEYNGVHYDLSTHSNDSDRIYELIAATTGASQVMDMTVSELPEGAEPFTGILGFDGYRVRVEESTPGFFIWHYYAEHEGKQVCIAEQFGYLVSGAEPEVYSIDLDGDTIPELVCNVVYGTGAERVIVYRNNGGIIEQGTIEQSYHENEFGADAWHDGANRIGEKYNPVEGSFVVTKTTSDGSIKAASFKGLDNFIFLPYDLHEANN